MKNKKYVCPVCGLDGLKELPFNKQGEPSYEICPCCGFEFGFDQASYAEFRDSWINSGAQWYMLKQKPKGWNLQKQLKNLRNLG